MNRISATKGTRIQRRSTFSTWPFVLAVFALSRLFFLVVGALAVALLPEANPAGDPLEPPGFLNYWANWDGAWYSEIATQGYGGHAPESTAFFPLYPVLVGLGARLIGGPAAWGVLISLVSTLFALYFVYGISEKLHGERVARHATLALALFPTAFFLNAVYTEALFLALTTGAIWAALVRRDLLLAGIIGAFAAATRNLGVLLFIPLLFEWWRGRDEFGVRGLLSLSPVPVGLLAYIAFLGASFGEPLIFAHQQQEYWGRTLTSPFVTAENAAEAAVVGAGDWLQPAALFLGNSPEPSFAASNALNLLFMVFLLVVLGAGFAVLPPGLSIYAAVITLLPVLTPAPQFPLMSMPRFALGTFPVFLILGFLLARDRRVSATWLSLSAAFGVALCVLFVTWRWVA